MEMFVHSKQDTFIHMYTFVQNNSGIKSINRLYIYSISVVTQKGVWGAITSYYSLIY